MVGKKTHLELIIEPIVTSLEYCFWGIEFLPRGRSSLLRVYIDSDDGISVEDCEKVSRQVSSVFDVEDPISEEYILEVSSPGINCPLFRVDHYKACLGSEVAIRLHMPFDGRRKYRGMIKGVEDQDVVIVSDNHEFLFPIENIEKAQVISQFG